MDDNMKDDFENITTKPKLTKEKEKIKNPNRVKGGLATQAKRRAALFKDQAELAETNNYLYIGIAVALVILILLKKTSSTPPVITPSTPLVTQPSEFTTLASETEEFDYDMFNL